MAEIAGTPRPTYRPRPAVASMPMEIDRERRTHVRTDGRPKICFATFEDAERERDRINHVYLTTGRDPVGVYRCWMEPEHYHLGSERRPR